MKKKWDYRRVTFLVGDYKPLRFYGIREVHYIDGKIDRIINPAILNYPDKVELEQAFKLMVEASTRPIIDIDNSFNEL